MTSQSTSPAANVELVRAAARAFNAGNTDECLARIAPDFIINLAGLETPAPGPRTLVSPARTATTFLRTPQIAWSASHWLLPY